MNKGVNVNSLDVAKFLLSFFVIAIHVRPLIDVNNEILCALFESFARCAVPVFFLASGYLLSRKISVPLSSEKNRQTIAAYARANLRLYLKWTAIYLPITIVHFVATSTGVVKALGSFLYGVVIFGQNYNSWPLWYLLSTFYAAIFMFVCAKKKLALNRILMIGAVLVFIGITLNLLYSAQLDNAFLGAPLRVFEFAIPDGRIFGGFLYIPLGMFIEKKWHGRISKVLTTRRMAVLFIAVLLLRIATNYMFVAEYITPCCSVLFFCLILRIRLRDRPFYKVLRFISMYNYLLHMYVWTVLCSIIYGDKTYGLSMFLLVSVVTTLISLIRSTSSPKNSMRIACSRE